MKIVVDVVNGEKMKELTAEIQRQEKEILQWNPAMKTAGPTQQAVLQTNMVSAGKSIGNMRTELKSLEAASGSAGRGLSQLSYAVDDIQYGFNAIVNNIPQIVMGLGGSAGIAGAVGIAAVAINQLIKHWGDLTAALQSAWEGGSAERLKVLAERATEAAEAFDKLAKAPTRFEEKGAKIVEQAIRDEPAENLRKQVTDAMLATGRGAPLPPAQAPGAGGAPGVIPTPGKTQKQAEQERYDATAEKAKILIGQIGQPGEAGRSARDEMNRLIQQIPGAFTDEFKKRFAESDPARVKQREEEEKAAALGQKAREEQKVADKEKVDSEKKVREGIVERLQTEKAIRVQGLEDERSKVQERMKVEAKDMAELQKKASEHGQILKGVRAATDYYQTSGSSKAQQALDAAKLLHEKELAKLEDIRKLLEKERRLVIPR